MSDNELQPPTEYPADVRVVHVGERQFILVGTAHISRESVELVRKVIEQQRPDHVCVELDKRRFEALAQRRRWETLDLRQVIRRRELATLLVNLMLSSYQKKLGGELGVQPGSELLEASRVAEASGIPVALCDRDVRVTLRRAWASLSFLKKMMLVSTFLASPFERIELDEEELRRLRQRDVMNELMRELGETLPTLKTVLIDERDAYLAQRIQDTPGRKVVAVVGAGHVAGMADALGREQEIDLEALETVPPVSTVWKWLGWAIPAFIVGAIGYIGYTKGPQAAGENALFWFLANGIPSAIGSAASFGHPLTVLAGFLSAPFTSLTPVIGAGYVTAFVQAYVRPPVVLEFQTVAHDIGIPTRWWRSRLLRVFLVFILTSLGSMLGTWVGGIEIASNLF